MPGQATRGRITLEAQFLRTPRRMRRALTRSRLFSPGRGRGFFSATPTHSGCENFPGRKLACLCGTKPARGKPMRDPTQTDDSWSTSQHPACMTPKLARDCTQTASVSVLKLFGQLPDPFRPNRTLFLQPFLLEGLTEVWHDPTRFTTVIADLLSSKAQVELHPEIAVELALLQTYYARQRTLASAWASARSGVPR